MTQNLVPTTDLLSLIEHQRMDDHLASLRYAGMIQHALLPDTDFLSSLLKDNFILFLQYQFSMGIKVGYLRIQPASCKTCFGCNFRRFFFTDIHSMRTAFEETTSCGCMSQVGRIAFNKGYFVFFV